MVLLLFCLYRNAGGYCLVDYSYYCGGCCSYMIVFTSTINIT